MFNERSLPLFKESGIEKLKNASVAVVGLGGVGSWCAEALVRAGVGNITVVDHDVISDSNRNRQLIALSSTVGSKKAGVEAERLKDINPECNIEALDVFLSAETLDAFDVTRFDYVADCIDTVTSKLALIKECNDKGVKIISAMGTGNRLDPSKIEVKDIFSTSGCPLARVMRRELRARNIESLKVVCSDEPSMDCIAGRDGETHKATPSSAVFVPAAAGLRMAYEIVSEMIL